MKLGIMQPYFFPYLGYWQLINAVDMYVVYDDVSYIKGGWIGRNNILLEGKKHLITLPLENSSSFKNINEVCVTKNMKIIDKLLRTINAAYKKAPYYKEIMPILESLLRDNQTISMLNYKSIIEINKYLDINTKIILSSQIEKNTTLKAQDKVIHICKILGANVYYNAIGGKELYNKEEFREHELEIVFLKMKNIEYKQYCNEFVPNLSIIDVLMFNSVEIIKKYMQEYILL